MRILNRVLTVSMSCFLAFSILPFDSSGTKSMKASAVETKIWNGEIDTSWYDGKNYKFTISTAEELAGLASLVNKGNSFKGQVIYLDSDIVLNELDDGWNLGRNDWTPIGTGGQPFKGTFDGNEHTIQGLCCINSDKLYVGLFGKIEGAEVKNINLTSPVVSADGNSGLRAGTIVGYCDSGTIANCTTSGHGSVYSSYVAGGICGFNNEGSSIEKCNNGIDTFCIITDDSENTNEKTAYAGGIVGFNVGKITNCVQSGAVKSTVEAKSYFYSMSAKGETRAIAGGICGYSALDISHCSNHGSVTAKNKNNYISDETVYTYAYSGGICGIAEYSNIEYCSSDGDIYAEISTIASDASYVRSKSAYKGGIVACSKGNVIINNCVNKGDMDSTFNTSSGDNGNYDYSGGIVGYTTDFTAIYDSYNINVNSLYYFASSNTTGKVRFNFYEGGISGYTEKTTDIRNCYSVSNYYDNISRGKFAGIAPAPDRQNAKVTKENCYYASTVTDPKAIEKSMSEMQTPEFAKSLGTSFTYVPMNYPVLSWEEYEITVGDINCDKEISIADAVLLQKYLLGIEKISEEQYKQGDINGDGVVNVFDMVSMRKVIIGLTSA